MRKLFLHLILGLISLSIVECEQSEKRKLSKKMKTDDIIKNVYTDDKFGDDDIEVIINNTRSTVTINIDGETYKLKKNNDLPNYTAENVKYKYSDINGEKTFLRKDYDMIIFHCRDSIH